MHLYNANRVIEKISGPIESFRAPALRINHSTFPILEKLGFKTDSSIASQRFDGPLTFGSLRKLNWLLAPRTPYFPNKSNPFSQGRLKIMEIPVSAFILAYQGTTMRISPELNKLLGSFLMTESKLTSKPVVFLFHPTEIINDKKRNIVNLLCIAIFLKENVGILLINKIEIIIAK